MRAMLTMTDQIRDIGTNIRLARERRGFSQNRLAKLVGISSGHLSAIESGGVKSPTGDLIAKIADQLGVSSDLLLGRDVSDVTEDAFAKLPKDLQEWLTDNSSFLFVGLAKDAADKGISPETLRALIQALEVAKRDDEQRARERENAPDDPQRDRN